jgi:hypothetical protein
MNVAELEAALAAAKKQEKAEGEEAWEALRKRIYGQLEWQVKWLDKYSVSVHARYLPWVLADIEALAARYPNSYGRINDERLRWRGMIYLLIGNVLVQTGGGWVVLDIPRNNVFRDWRELTDEQAAALRADIVPDELKHKQFG